MISEPYFSAASYSTGLVTVISNSGGLRMGVGVS